MITNRKFPSNYIKPSLMLNDETNSNIKSNIKGGTRPPVVGREESLDPDGTQLYDSSNKIVSNYLKTLEQKVTSRNMQQANSSNVDDNLSQSSSSNIEVGNSSLFLKNGNRKRLTSIQTSSGKAKPTLVLNMPSRMSSALQKAQQLSNKYKPAPSNVSDCTSSDEKSNASMHSKEEPLSLSTRESLQRLINVKALDDLPALSNKDSETDENFEFQLKSINDLADFLDNKSVDASIRDTSKSSQRQNNTSLDKLDIEIDHYEDDFEESKNTNEILSWDAEENLINEEVQSRNESDEYDPVDGISLNTKPSVEISNTGSSHLDRAARPFVQAKAVRKKQALTTVGIHKETQTNLDNSTAAPASAVILLRNWHMVLPRSHYEEFSHYSGSDVILNRMTRQNLHSIKLFLNMQKQSYQTAINALKPNFRYTTWETCNKMMKKQSTKK